MRYGILQVLRTFTYREIRDFRSFLISPYFNKNEKLVQLFDILILDHPVYHARSLNKELLYEELYKGKKYNDNTFRSLMFDLYNLSLSYLKYSNVENKGYEAEEFLVEELVKRELTEVLESRLEDAEEKFKIKGQVDAALFLSKFKMLTDKANISSMFGLIKNKKNAEETITTLTERAKYLTFFYVIEMVKKYYNFTVYFKNYNLNASNNFVMNLFQSFDFKDILDFMKKRPEYQGQSKIFEIYYMLMMSFKNLGNLEYYKKYKNLLTEKIDQFSVDERQFLFASLIDYCVYVRNNNLLNEEEIDKELYNVYKTTVEGGYYKTSQSQTLSVQLYRNIVINGIKLKKYKWVEEFIDTYTAKLPKPHRKHFNNWAMAHLHYSRGMYRDAMLAASKVNFDFFIFKIDLRDLQLKTYYELGLFDSAISLIFTYRKFLYSDETLSEEKRQRFLNFINFTVKLIDAKLGREPEVEFMQHKLDKTENISNMQWLSEKISELGSEGKMAG